jgi:hypothetical protein
MEYRTRAFKQSLFKAGDVKKVIINKRGGSVFEYNEIDSFFTVNKNIFYSMYHVLTT